MSWETGECADGICAMPAPRASEAQDGPVRCGIESSDRAAATGAVERAEASMSAEMMLAERGQ